MEERIIDDEYGRGIRLKKTKDGYVDVTDELVEEGFDDESLTDMEEVDEVEFEFPDMEEDDEDLVGLSPEEAARVRKEKAEAAERLRAEYDAACKEGESLLENEDFAAAERKYEEALQLDGIATQASVGYWRAKTSNFANPDVLIDEYVESGIDGMEYDLGYEAVQIIKREYHGRFEQRIVELTAEEKPLAKEVRATQSRRREYLSQRRTKAMIAFVLTALPFIAGLIVTLVIGLKNFSTPDNRYVVPTIVMGAVSAALFAVFGVFINKLINACRIYNANENLLSTDEGTRLVEIRAYKELYAEMLTEEAQAEQEEQKEQDDEE